MMLDLLNIDICVCLFVFEETRRGEGIELRSLVVIFTSVKRCNSLRMFSSSDDNLKSIQEE